MKRIVAFVVCLLISVPAFAGFGIHFNYDMLTIDEDVQQFTFDGDPTGTSLASISREEMNSAIGGGIDISFGMIPVIDLMLSLEGSYGTYQSAYYSQVGGVVYNEPEAEDLPFLRVGADLTATFTVFPFPTLGGIYVGAGPSFMMVAPIASEELVRDNFESAEDVVDVQDLADDIQAEFGGHVTVGAKLKPVGSPVGFRVGAKYYFIPTFEDPAPTSWLTFMAGITIG